MTDTPQVLLAHHLKTLKLPTFLREYDKLARQCATEGADHVRYLVRLTELELIDRERRMVERRIRQARFPAVKSLDSFDFKAIASLNKMLVLELARCEYVERRENIIALGNSGTGKTHIALGLGLAACQKGLSVGITCSTDRYGRPGSRATDKGQGCRRGGCAYRSNWQSITLWCIDVPGFVPSWDTFNAQLEERSAATSARSEARCAGHRPDYAVRCASGRRYSARNALTGALLDRLTHHVDILRQAGRERVSLNQSQKLVRYPDE